MGKVVSLVVSWQGFATDRLFWAVLAAIFKFDRLTFRVDRELRQTATIPSCELKCEANKGMVDDLPTAYDVAAEVDEIAVKKRRAVWMSLGYAAIFGVVGVHLSEQESPVETLLGVPLLLLGVWWCFLDAEQRGFRISGVMKWAIIFVFMVGFPVYIFRTRGMGGFVTLAYVFLLVVAMVLCMFVAAIVTLLLEYLLGYADLEAVASRR